MHTPNNHPSRSSVANQLYKNSFYSQSQSSSKHGEQNLKRLYAENLNPHLKQRSTSLSLAISSLKLRPTMEPGDSESTIGVPSRFCSVCGDISTGIHFGGNSCESCKAFFRRSVQCSRFQSYKCSNDEHCPINIVTRKVCQFCRYTKCTAIGMKAKWVLSDQERAEKYGSRRKCDQENRASEDPEIYKYLSKDEKVLIEDIAHALYQARATYSLQFPTQLNQYLKSLSSGIAPPAPPTPSATGEKPPNPSANFLIVPIQRFVLFARMIKDFDLFSEDDKVNLLKGGAIEAIVCSSNTLFDPKTHSFTNYVSRDQRAVMDDQVIPLDPLLKKLWGEELFVRTKSFLVSMCNLQIDEVASTLLVPVILFSPDRPNLKDLDLVKRLQTKYATLIRKYMNWRYGVQRTELIYARLLLQVVNIRTLSLAHAEIIQKVMATSSVNPLVQEITVKQEVVDRTTTERMHSFSIDSMPSGSEMMDCDKPSSVETESTLDSEDEESARKKTRSSTEDETEDSSDIIPRNIWRKKRKLSSLLAQKNDDESSSKALLQPPTKIKQEFERSNSIGCDPYPYPQPLPRRPHDHQVPTYRDDFNLTDQSSSFRHLSPRKQAASASAKREHLLNQMHSTDSSSTNDLSAKHFHPTSRSHDEFRLPYSSRMPPASFQQQQQNEQHLHYLSLASNNQYHPSPIANVRPTLDAEEQQLLNAIHSHPNKRDLVLSLLRQMDESSPVKHSPQQQFDPYQQYSGKIDYNNRSY